MALSSGEGWRCWCMTFLCKGEEWGMGTMQRCWGTWPPVERWPPASHPPRISPPIGFPSLPATCLECRCLPFFPGDEFPLREHCQGHHRGFPAVGGDRVIWKRCEPYAQRQQDKARAQVGETVSTPVPFRVPLPAVTSWCHLHGQRCRAQPSGARRVDCPTRARLLCNPVHCMCRPALWSALASGWWPLSLPNCPRRSRGTC